MGQPHIQSILVSLMLVVSIATAAGGVAASSHTGGAVFEVQITGTNEPVVEGDTLTVTATVTNTGDAEDSQQIHLVKNNPVEIVDSVANPALTLAPGESANVTLTWDTAEGDAATEEISVQSDDSVVWQPIQINEGAAFDVETTGTNAPVAEGETLTVDATVTNVGDTAASQTISLTDAEGTVLDTTAEPLTLSPGESASVSLTWETAAGDAGTTELGVQSDDAVTWATVEVDEGDSFAPEITETNSPVRAGENLSVTVTVTNTGDVSGTQPVSLTGADGETLAANDDPPLTLAPGENATVVLTWQTNESDVGVQNVSVVTSNGLDTHEVEVRTPRPQTRLEWVLSWFETVREKRGTDTDRRQSGLPFLDTFLQRTQGVASSENSTSTDEPDDEPLALPGA